VREKEREEREEFCYTLRHAIGLYFHAPFATRNFKRYPHACGIRRQKWLDCLTNDIQSWPFLPRQISCLELVSARDMQIALIYTGSGDCCLVRLATTSQIGVVWAWRTCLSIDCHAWHHASRIPSLKSFIRNRGKNKRIVEYEYLRSMIVIIKKYKIFYLLRKYTVHEHIFKIWIFFDKLRFDWVQY